MSRSEHLEFLKAVKHGVIAYERTDHPEFPIKVVHFVGFHNPVTDEQVTRLCEELNTDPEFNLVGKINKTVFLKRASKQQVDFYKEELS